MVIANNVLVIKALPSSFVASNMKLSGDSGSGEAKLFVGNFSDSDEIDSFFALMKGIDILLLRTIFLFI